MVFNDHRQRDVSTQKQMWFPTAEARDEKATEVANLRRNRMMVASLTRAEMDEYRAFKEAAGGIPWPTILAGYHANQKATGGTSGCTLTVANAVTDYLAIALALRDEGKLAADSYRHSFQKLTLFSEQFGHLPMDRVATDEIRDWVDDFDEVQADVTFDNYVKHVRALYNWAITEKKALRDNPCAGIKKRYDSEDAEVGIISVEQTAQLFHTALTYRNKEGVATFMPAVGRLALEAFIGLRHTSGCKIAKCDINFADKGLTLPKKKLKTKKRHYIDDLPSQLWDWLAIAPDECWELTPRQYAELKNTLFPQARVPHPHNCLRHNFATYYTAAFKNPGRTATILCHRDQEQLWRHYNGRATMEQGKRYQTITPRTAAKMAVGFVPDVPPAVPPPAPAAR